MKYVDQKAGEQGTSVSQSAKAGDRGASRVGVGHLPPQAFVLCKSLAGEVYSPQSTSFSLLAFFFLSGIRVEPWAFVC